MCPSLVEGGVGWGGGWHLGSVASITSLCLDLLASLSNYYLGNSFSRTYLLLLYLLSRPQGILIVSLFCNSCQVPSPFVSTLLGYVAYIVEWLRPSSWAIWAFSVSAHIHLCHVGKEVIKRTSHTMHHLGNKLFLCPCCETAAPPLPDSQDQWSLPASDSTCWLWDMSSPREVSSNRRLTLNGFFLSPLMEVFLLSESRPLDLQSEETGDTNSPMVHHFFF